MIKNLLAKAVDVRDVDLIPGSGRPPGGGHTAIHSSILARRIPWTEEPGSLESMGLQRVGHDLSTEKQQYSAVLLYLLLMVNAHHRGQIFGNIYLDTFLIFSLLGKWKRNFHIWENSLQVHCDVILSEMKLTVSSTF